MAKVWLLVTEPFEDQMHFDVEAIPTLVSLSRFSEEVVICIKLMQNAGCGLSRHFIDADFLSELMH